MSNPKKTTKPTIGQKIKKARKSVGLSQKELGDILKVSDKTVSAYEVGRANPSYRMLKQIGQVTSKPISYFDEDADAEEVELTAKLKIIEKELGEIKQLLKQK